MWQILEHVGEPTSALAIAPARSPSLEMKIGQRLAAPEAVFEAIHELEFDQTANLTARPGHDRLLHDAGIAAEPILEVEFDQTLGWQSRAVEMAHAVERGWAGCRRWLGAGWLDAGADWVVDTVPAYAERALRKYLECDILAHGFARAKFYSWRLGRHGKKAGVREIYSRYSGRCPRDLSSSVTPDTRINSTIISSGLPIAQTPAGLAAASRYRPHHSSASPK